MADEDQGLVKAESQAFLSRAVDDVEIRVSLDENALTRVDASSTARTGKGDRGRNARRLRRFFRKLDKRIGAGPGLVLDPTIPLIRTTLILMALVVGCGQTDGPPPEAEPTESDSVTQIRNFQAISYERHIVFLTFQEDSALLVPWFFSAQTRPDGVGREVRGWLARGDTWDPFLAESWADSPNAAPWRILPRGPVRLIVGLEDALETILFQEGGRNLEMNLGELLVEWSGQRAQTYRVHEGTIILSDQTVEGYILDLTRAWAEEDSPPGDWGILLSGDSLQVVLEDLEPESGPEGGAFSLWARVQFLGRQWQEVRLAWSEVRSYEPARRDVPMRWGIQSVEGDLGGALTTVSPFLEAEEGEGPMLPLRALFQVEGNITLGEGSYPVRGLIRHVQH
jgi:hypothetical protein